MTKPSHLFYSTVMKKDFGKNKLLDMPPQKQIKVLYDLASFIELLTQVDKINSTHFEKLAKYHLFLKDSSHEKIKILNKEFFKIKTFDYQYQIYLMNLERFVGQSKKEYEFLVQTKDAKSPTRQFDIKCLLDSIRSAHNVGAMFRNAECFGNNEIILCGLSPTPQNAQVIKTAMSSNQFIKWSYKKDAIDAVKMFKKEGYQIWAMEKTTESVDINSIENIPTKLILIFGHELHGVSFELLNLSDQVVEIPLYGRKNSLNVSVSQAIVLNQITSLM